jgi:hypothetical protein
MFGWLTWGKPAHSMADLDTVRELVAGLPGHDPARALDNITAWLEEITQSREFDLQERWASIDLLDKAAVVPRRKLEQDYISAPQLPKADEARLWNAAFGFWKILNAAYLRCNEIVRGGAAGAEAVRKELPLIAARALRASSQQLKWSYLRHSQIDARIWRELGSAYLFAEGQGVAAVRAELYPDQQPPSSPQEELLKGLMLVAASPYNLTTLKQHIAERVIAYLGSRFVLQGKAAPDCGFAFDLARPRPPARLQQEMATGSMVRYFGAGEARRGLADLTQEVRAKDGVPRYVNLGGEFEQATVLSVLAHLERYWDSTPPARRAARSGLVTRVTVVPGLPNILRCLELIANGAPLNPRSFPQQESWATADKSDGGYGVLVPAVRASFEYDPLTGNRTGSGDWLRIGSLLALGEENAPIWRVGIVRRITQVGSDQRNVGIELLEGLAIVIKLSMASGPRSGEPERRRAAVLMSSATDKTDEALVLMRAGHFTTTQTLNMHLYNKHYLLLPIALVEGGDDFDCARFKIIPD